MATVDCGGDGPGSQQSGLGYGGISRGGMKLMLLGKEVNEEADRQANNVAREINKKVVEEGFRLSVG